MRSAFLICFFSLISLSAAPPVIQVLPGGKTLEDGGREVDSFISRTFDRISVAWGMCWEEFRLASSEVVEESKKVIKQEVEKQTDKVVEKVSETAKEAVRDTIP
ncbi:MAG: hypothetical protein IKB16_12550 [Lentisphaeria bacterium]|nr:hypothetical protein [Lentisphaeria bacterium]